MSSIATQSPLVANLACLGDSNRDVVGQIRARTAAGDLSLVETTQGVPTATWKGSVLASRRRPLDEAGRLAASVDVIENAVVAVMGFGLGYHVRALAERMRRAGVIIVFEPDVDLLRAVMEQIDHSPWMKDTLLVFVTDCDDRGSLARKLSGADAIIAQGLDVLEHPPSRARLAGASGRFTAMLTDFVRTSRTTMMTTLVRSVDTVRNVLHNVVPYVGGSGVADLAGAAQDRLGVVVSAGPSLRRNIDQLSAPGVRDRCVIVAVQTTLKPLLEAGVKPHFVTALDYHEISTRFYEGLSEADVAGVTLVIEPKAHPAIARAFPGPVRCCGNDFMDKVLGDLKRDMGQLPAGATVAHLAVYLARHLGCNPITLIGQDLGFTDGLYYAPGTAIHDVWGPELNEFNTIAMMEWQRIARHRSHLESRTDVRGEAIYTDAQMLAYLQQFERDFAEYREAGIDIIDATEGGLPKQHTVARSLADVLAAHTTPLDPLPAALVSPDRNRVEAAEERLAAVQREVRALRRIACKTRDLIRRMLAEQHDEARMARHFARIERYRAEVSNRMETFELLNYVNQLGVFKRNKADRRLFLSEQLGDGERQHLQLERDLENVIWIGDAAGELADQLAEGRDLIAGRTVSVRSSSSSSSSSTSSGKARVAALVPIDPERNGLGRSRSLTEPFRGTTVLQATLQRLGRSRSIDAIILIVPDTADTPDAFDIETYLDRDAVDRPVIIERSPSGPFGPERDAIAVARWWADTCWRGGIAGMSAYDEVLCPQAMLPVMERHDLAAALLVGPDWPLLDVSSRTGCDAIVDRYREHPDDHRLVFTQAPPGVCGCVVRTDLMRQLAERHRLSTIGSLLAYLPHLPQGDPIARDANVQIDPRVRDGLVRATADSPRRCRGLERCLTSQVDLDDPASVIAAIEADAATHADTPRHVVLELTTERSGAGRFRTLRGPLVTRAPLARPLAERLFDQLENMDDIVLTLGGAGDPLMHDAFDDIVRLARAAGVQGVHVRTELLSDDADVERLLSSGVDVISVDLNADCAETYRRMMGHDRFGAVIERIRRLVEGRRHVAGPAGPASFALPWIVPRITRCAETLADVEGFFDRWLACLGTAVIDAPIAPEHDTLTPVAPPARIAAQEQRRRLFVCCDGSVPVDERPGAPVAGTLARDSLATIVAARAAR